MASEEIKRIDLSIKGKLSIIESYDKLPKVSQRSVPVALKISQILLCTILKNRDIILKAAKETKTSIASEIVVEKTVKLNQS